LSADETPTSAAQPEADGAPVDVPAPEQAPERPAKSLTIGAVCKALQQEFPDISISKIRYLEDQKLLSPRRTPGGYRLYSSNDVSRLRTILRLQRDEFLPLRVIRQELAAGRTEADIAQPTPTGTPSGDARPGAALRRITFSLRDRGALYSLEEVVEETGAEPRLIAELEEYGIVKGIVRGGARYYDDTEREIVRATTELARYGVAGRNLRVFRTSPSARRRSCSRSSRRRCARAIRSAGARRSRRSRTSPPWRRT
jgi:DNA-binding transcriptional MerR regulator